MRRVDSLLFIGLLMILTLTGCGATSSVTTATPNLPTATGVAMTDATMTSSPSSHPATDNALGAFTDTYSDTCLDDQELWTDHRDDLGEHHNDVPSNPQPLEDCFTNAFMKCQSATLAITFIDSTGKIADGLRTPPPHGDCEVAAVDETKFATNGSVTSSTSFTCAAMVPSGGKCSLGNAPTMSGSASPSPTAHT